MLSERSGECGELVLRHSGRTVNPRNEILQKGWRGALMLTCSPLRMQEPRQIWRRKHGFRNEQTGECFHHTSAIIQKTGREPEKIVQR